MQYASTSPLPGIKSVLVWTLSIVVGLFVLSLVFGSWFRITEGQRGLVTRFGAATGEVYGSGLHFKLPIVDDVKKFDIQKQRYAFDRGGADDTGGDLQAASKDLQAVETSVSLLFHLAPDSILDVYRQYGTDYVGKIVAPNLREATKAVTARYTADELVTKRDIVRSEIIKELHARFDGTPIAIDDFNIVNFKFTDQYQKAIDAKVTQEQVTKAEELKKQQTQAQADQQVIAAKGKAEANRIEGEAAKESPVITQLRAIEKWDGHLPQIMGGNTPFVNLPTPTK